MKSFSIITILPSLPICYVLLTAMFYLLFYPHYHFAIFYSLFYAHCQSATFYLTMVVCLYSLISTQYNSYIFQVYCTTRYKTYSIIITLVLKDIMDIIFIIIYNSLHSFPHNSQYLHTTHILFKYMLHKLEGVTPNKNVTSGYSEKTISKTRM